MRQDSDAVDRLGPIWVYLVALTLFFLRFGYGFGLGDQDETLPYLLHLLDSSLFENDWFVQTQIGGFGVRTYFVLALLPFCWIVPVEIVFHAAYLLLWLAVANGAYRLALELGTSRLAASVAVVICLGILHKWTLGSNDLVYSMLVPEMAAWALALPAVRLWLNGRQAWAGVLLGIATWFQLLAGLLVFGVLILERIWSNLAKPNVEAQWRPLLAIAWFTLAASPALVPIALQQLAGPAISSEESVFYILAPFRNPLHHMLLTFPTKSLYRFAIMVAAGGSALLFLRAREEVNHAGFLARVGFLTLVAVGLMFAFTELAPVLIIAKFQAYKLTVLLKLLLIIVIVAAGIAVLPDSTSDVLAKAERLLVQGRARVVMLVGLIVGLGVVWFALPELVEDRLAAKTHESSELGRMESWINANTDRGAIFAIPPSNNSFRSVAQRAVVVNFMAFPYSDSSMIDWYRRIQGISPVDRVERDPNPRTILDASFNKRSREDLSRLAAVYGFQYVLREALLVELQPVHTVGTWNLYRIQ